MAAFFHVLRPTLVQQWQARQQTTIGTAAIYVKKRHAQGLGSADISHRVVADHQALLQRGVDRAIEQLLQTEP